MTTITEDYVSFETAKLLKEKGFNTPGKVWYAKYTSQFNGKKYNSLEFDDKNRFDESYKFLCYAPTFQMAMKWLREVHKIAIVITPSIFWEKYNVSIYKKGNDYPFGFDGDSFCPSYEEACEASIKYCLENLIRL